MLRHDELLTLFCIHSFALLYSVCADAQLISPIVQSPTNKMISQQQQQQQQQQTSSSFLDYFSTSFSNKSIPNEQPHQTTKASPSPQPTETTVPLGVVSKKLWISDNEVSICMCCNETQFSMFNRRHHCRRCGRVVCKPCSQHTTVIKERLERTCKDCYQHTQNNQVSTTNSRQETNNSAKKLENLRS